MADTPLETLTALGFTQIGAWSLRDGAPLLTLSPYVASAPTVLYAFVRGATVMYLGKSTMSFKQRLYGYVKPGVKQATNIRVHALIKGALTEGVDIRVFGFAPQEDVRYKSWRIDLAAGLEDALIQALQPTWNVRIGTLGEGVPA